MFDKLGREEQAELAYEAGFDEGYDEARTDALRTRSKMPIQNKYDTDYAN